VSRLPRHLEHLKTGFTAEAVSAAKFRAYASRAEKDGLPNLARHWLGLAAAKDALAVAQLDAAGQARGGLLDIGAALAEENYENDVLYPKMAREVDDETRGSIERTVAAQKEHVARLDQLRVAFSAARGDVEPPAG
jgi:rubrerythrin